MSTFNIAAIASIYSREKKNGLILISNVTGTPFTTSISHMVCQSGWPPRKQKPPTDKISFINRWYMIWWAIQDSNL